ncbi:hypothetical protein FNF27_07282 [Cafeteria roenbergensis]|nr:hypothetical protein FNF28_05397 [Cafeteria roenbergensis]KAA0167616.1 hypothetical protein FNF27_07282 [Cafeteria roenbergensis]
MAAVGSVYLVAMVLVLALGAGPQPEVALVMLWPVLAHFALAAFYVFDVDVATRWLGKVPTASAGAVWAFWLARHLVSLPLVGERPYDAVAEGIYVGRWPIRFPSEFPAHCPNVVDLTAELPARADVIRGRRYACVPALDCTMPLPGALIAAAATVGGWPGGVYVHCANGHGRSACFAALLMVLRGESATWRAAVEQMKTVRPLVSVHGTQAALMDDVEASMRAAGMLPPLAAEGAVPAASPAVAAVEMAERERDAGAGSD